MNPEDALLNYLYPRLVEALQTWKGFDDIYGIWIGLILYEDEPGSPSINVMGCLRESCLGESYSSEPGGYWSPEWMNPITSFEPWLCAHPCPDNDEDPADYDPASFHPGDPEGRALRDAFFLWRRNQPSSPMMHNEAEESEQKFQWFLEVCGALIRKFHESGTLAEICGQPIPVGFGIGDGDTRTLTIVRDNNPDRLSKGMEEWMMKETYAEIAAHETFCSEVFAWPLEQQAHFYVQGAIGYHGEKRGLLSTPEWEWAREKGRSGMGLDWTSPAAHLFLGQVLPEIEKRATAKRSFPSGTYPETEQADDLLSFFWIPSDYLTRLPSPIPEADIDRLYALLKRLYEESKTLEEIGSTLRHTARALHDLCPERFPITKIGWRQENMNRLLESEKFGLE
nr:hypothetical protein [Armatimonas sp.]